MTTENQDTSTPPPSKNLQQQYQETLLKTGIQAAELLSELIGLKLMPDPRAKELADVALEVIKIVNSTPIGVQTLEANSNKQQTQNQSLPDPTTSETPKKSSTRQTRTKSQK